MSIEITSLQRLYNILLDLYRDENESNKDDIIWAMSFVEDLEQSQLEYFTRTP